MNIQPTTLNDILRWRAGRQPARLAYAYLADREEEKARVTYAELDALARAVAARLQSLGGAGERALLLFPAGLDFITTFYGCLYTGVVAMPAAPPHPARPRLTLPRIRSIIADSGAAFVLTTSAILSRVEPLFADDEAMKGVRWLATDAAEALDIAPPDEWREPKLSGDSLAVLQYTSGSTSAPKGVMVTHDNLLYNSAYIRDGFRNSPECVSVTWLPAHHDMGLVDGLIQPMFVGFPCYVMAPTDFLQRPLRWLRALSRYRATNTGAPNFAYDLCTQKVTPEQRDTLDLSSLRVAFNGAEPIRHETIRRFVEHFGPCGLRPDVIYSAYGLAEATLKVTAGDTTTPHTTRTLDAAALERNRVVAYADAPDAPPGGKTFVGCGKPSSGTRVRIIDPETLTPCEPGRVGEIWVAGPTVAAGYWNRPDLTEEVFGARLAGTGEGPFLRTGDTGFLDGDDLYVTGRLKDLIIIGGRNHYPQDIELTVEQSHPAVRSGGVAAFSVVVEGAEQLVIAAEVNQRHRPASHAPGDATALDLKSLTRAVQRDVSDQYGIGVHALALLKMGSIPITSSGKIRRQECRQRYLTGALEYYAGGESRRPFRATHTQIFPQYEAAQALELSLGDPFAPGGVFSLADAVALDEREAYPEDACRLLDDLRFFEFYIPPECGGRLESVEELVAVLRTVARRDLTVAVAHGKTFLGAVATWVGGSDEQKRRVSEIIRGGGQLALALTERAHGGDLLASEVEAERAAGGYRLSGEKWLINNATRSRALTVFARTSEQGGPRGFSLFLVDKEEAARASFSCLPKVRTHGVRGADISGIRFDGTLVSAEARVGDEGAGLEVMLKGFQLTRTAIAGLSLGAADTALRVTLDFARARRLYGDTVFAIPHARVLLREAFVDLLICECATVAIARSFHVEPEQMGVRSAVAKFFIPTTVEGIIKKLSVVLGARQYLRQEHCGGVFQKIYRDNALLSLFDGSTVVNLSAIGSHLARVARGGDRGRPGEAADRISRLATLGAPLPPFDARAITLHQRGRDSLLLELETAAETLSSLHAPGDDAGALVARLVRQARELTTQLAELHEAVSAGLGEHGIAFNHEPEMFELAERYCTLLAGACCLHLWLHNRAALDDFFARGEWLALALQRLLRREGEEDVRDPETIAYEQNVLEELRRRHEARTLFSIVPLQLAQPSPAGVS
ncbi:MAG: AMP-binding protein [Pyrinomonadaceae bacterium]